MSRRRVMTPAERIAKRVVIDFETGCWQWTGRIGTDGYGRLTVEHRRWQAHRWVYTFLVEPILHGLTLDHLCRNIICVNPDHLEPVTIGENIRRGWAARRAALAVAS